MSVRTERSALRLAAIGVLAAGLLGCASSRYRGATDRWRDDEVASDTSAFAAVLSAIVADTSAPWLPHSFHVDPRPLRNDRELFVVSTSSWASVTREEILERERTVRRLGLAADDAEVPAGCSGTLVPAPSPERPRPACPQHRHVVVAIGVPSRQDTRAPEVRLQDNSRLTMRVLVEDVGPDGRNTRAADCVIEGASGRWKVVGITLVRWTE